MTPPITLACIAPPEVLRERVRARAEHGGSDAGLDVLEAQLSEAQETPVGIFRSAERVHPKAALSTHSNAQRASYWSTQLRRTAPENVAAPPGETSAVRSSPVRAK